MTITTLNQLHSDIEGRVSSIIGDNLDWPCRMGCDSCCRRLAEIHLLTEVECDLLRDGLVLLPAEQFQKIVQGVAELSGQSSRPLICPMLDQATGSCTVYAHRPISCRTYGFYVHRDTRLY